MENRRNNGKWKAEKSLVVILWFVCLSFFFLFFSLLFDRKFGGGKGGGVWKKGGGGLKERRKKKKKTWTNEQKDWDWTRASVSKQTADSSLLSNKMAEDVNNDTTHSKTEERKIVVEFCQLQEKSRQLFNSLRCDSYLWLFLTPVFSWSWNISQYAELRMCCYSSVGWAQQRVTVCVLRNRCVRILSAPLLFFVFSN